MNNKTIRPVIFAFCCAVSLGINPAQGAGITACGGHAFKVFDDGTVWAWGNNDYGQLGNGTNLSTNLPVQVINLTGATAVAAGWIHSLALKSDGTIMA